jgi:hypothetical protein
MEAKWTIRIRKETFLIFVQVLSIHHYHSFKTSKYQVLWVHNVKPFLGNYLYMQSKKRLNLFVHNIISLHIYIHLWG